MKLTNSAEELLIEQQADLNLDDPATWSFLTPPQKCLEVFEALVQCNSGI